MARKSKMKRPERRFTPLNWYFMKPELWTKSNCRIPRKTATENLQDMLMESELEIPFDLEHLYSNFLLGALEFTALR